MRSKAVRPLRRRWLRQRPNWARMARVIIRPSGTEPCVRVMVEASEADVAERHARAIAAVVEAEL